MAIKALYSLRKNNCACAGLWLVISMFSCVGANSQNVFVGLDEALPQTIGPVNSAECSNKCCAEELRFYFGEAIFIVILMGIAGGQKNGCP